MNTETIKPGIHRGISWEDYRAIDLPSPSLLKHGLRSMKRLKRAIDGELPQPAEAVTAVGNAVHCMIAGEFAERCIVIPEFEKQPQNLTIGVTKTKPESMLTKKMTQSAAGRKWVELCQSNGFPDDYAGDIVTGQRKTESKSTSYYEKCMAEFEETHGDKIMLSKVQHNVALKTAREIHQNADANQLIEITEASNSSELVVIGEIEGVMVKTRMDGLIGDHGWDLKTTSDIEPDAFYRKFKQMGYGFQFACHYLLLQSNGIALNRYSVIAAETQDDFDVGLLDVPNQLIDVWMAKVMKVMRAYRVSMELDYWPGLYAEPDVLTVPNWDLSSDDELEGFDE